VILGAGTSDTEYFVGDALGSVRQLTNPAGAVTYAATSYGDEESRWSELPITGFRVSKIRLSRTFRDGVNLVTDGFGKSKGFAEKFPRFICPDANVL
jgi:hypothetical protein